MNQMLFYIIMSFMIMLLAFMMNSSHLLMSLLYLEGMMLSMVIYIPMLLSPTSSIHQISLLLLTFSACEASLGLSMIVKLSRSHGSDLLSSTAMNSC